MLPGIFTQEFLDNIPDDDLDALKYVISSFQQQWALTQQRAGPNDYLKVYSFLQAIGEQRSLPIKLPPPTFQRAEDIQAMKQEVDHVTAEISPKLKDRERRIVYQEAQDFYQAHLRGSFAYEFLDTDYKRIQELVGDLRTLTAESKQLDPGHKRRLLKRIEKVQTELHKKMSSLDSFWGLLADVGVAFGKFGQDVKPLIDRTREILKIVAKTQARAEGLPQSAANPMLPALEDNKEDE